MQEKILNQKKNGMLALILIILSYLLAIGGLVIFASSSTVLLMVVCILWLSIGWISLLGLKILKPQEALVLTLFGKYIGTLKEEGLYYVNPFCSSVNPASKTKLKQSGDVDATNNTGITIGSIGGHANVEANNKRISLKIMTLSNNKQKINDCLGICSR